MAPLDPVDGYITSTIEIKWLFIFCQIVVSSLFLPLLLYPFLYP